MSSPATASSPLRAPPETSHRDKGWVRFRCAAESPVVYIDADLPGVADPAGEVVAHFRYHGEDAPTRLHGEFAFALWDPATACLFAATDPFGLRRLYWTTHHGAVLVGASAARLARETGAALDPEPIRSWACGPVWPNRSAFHGIRLLPPGYRLRIDRSGERLERWWTPERLPPLRYRRTDDYLQDLRELLDAAVSRSLADSSGPLALELSGGMDTTSIAALVRAQQPGREIHAFTRRFADHPEREELHYAREVAERLRLHLHSCRPQGEPGLPLGLEPQADGPWCLYDRMLSASVGPAIGQGCDLLLTGNGGDELFFGTPLAWTYPMLRLHLPTWRAVNRIRREMGLDRSHTLVYALLYPFLRPTQVQRLRRWAGRPVGPPWALETAASALSEAVLPGNANQRQLFALLASAGTPWLLEAVRTQATALRVRHPFYDRPLAEFVFRTPAELWRRGELTKWPIRRLMADLLPASVLQRRDKSNFQPVYHDDVRRCAEPLRELLQQSPLEELGIADAARLRVALQASLQPGGPPPSAALRASLSTAIWLRRFPPTSAAGTVREPSAACEHPA